MNDEASSATAETVLGLDPRALLARAAENQAENPGDRIGHYALIEQIGEGGFGTVWRAEQSEPVQRQVALKIIKLKSGASSVRRSRRGLRLRSVPWTPFPAPPLRGGGSWIR